MFDFVAEKIIGGCGCWAGLLQLSDDAAVSLAGKIQKFLKLPFL